MATTRHEFAVLVDRSGRSAPTPASARIWMVAGDTYQSPARNSVFQLPASRVQSSAVRSSSRGGLRRVAPDVIAWHSPFSKFSAECENASVYVFPKMWTHTPLPRDVALEPSIAYIRDPLAVSPLRRFRLACRRRRAQPRSMCHQRQDRPCGSRGRSFACCRRSSRFRRIGRAGSSGCAHARHGDRAGSRESGNSIN